MLSQPPPDWPAILADMDWPTITLDLDTLTLGDLAAAERASGRSFETLTRGAASLRMLALFFHLSRTYGSAPPWHALESLPALGALRSTSRSSRDGVSPTSSR